MRKIAFFSIALALLSGCAANKPQSSVRNSELTIATLNENGYLEDAARRYEELHEGVTIIIDSYAGEGNDKEKYSQIINTALMSGQAEDIIDVSALAWVRLADKNKLLDLNSVLEFPSEDYYTNIMDAYLYDGKRYAIPMSFAFEAYRYSDTYEGDDKDAELTLDELLSLAKKYPESPLFDGGGGGMSAASLADKLFRMNFNKFVDVSNKKADIDNRDFISLLEKINSISERIAVKNEGDASLMNQYYLYTPAMCHNGLIDYTDMFLLTDDKGESNFATIGFLPAVNADKNANSELAVDFIRFLLSEEMQTSTELLFNPVNKKAAINMAELSLADSVTGGYAPEGFSGDNLIKNIEIFNILTERLTVVDYSDKIVNKFIWDELTRYFNGEADAEQAAKNLQSTLNTYLNE